MADRKGRQEPGDYTVTPFPGGYLIGRLGPRTEHGFAWTYQGNDADLQTATRKARKLAESDGTEAWMYEARGNPQGHYSQIPIGPPESN